MASVTLMWFSALLATPILYLVWNLVHFFYSLHLKTKAVLQWPGLPTHWLYGNLYQHKILDPEVRKSKLGDKIIEWMRSLNVLFPRGYYFLYTPLRPVLHANHPDIVREVLKRGDGKPHDAYNIVRAWLGDGLLLSGGKKWARNRRLLTPAFHFDILKSYIAVYNDAVDVLLANGENLIASRKYIDFLDILLSAKDENGVGLTDLEIRNEVDTFLFEGHDTTACGLTWMLYSLAKYPEYQGKAQQEIDNILDDRGTESVEWDDLPNFKYLALCIKESLRSYPPVPIVARQTDREIVIDGKMLPAGSTIYICINALHHHPEVWTNPSEFIPERFLPENAEKRDAFAFIPFVAGSRNCIGQNFAMHEIKVILARILRRFDLTLDPNHEVHFGQELLLKPANDVKINLKLRK